MRNGLCVSGVVLICATTGLGAQAPTPPAGAVQQNQAQTSAPTKLTADARVYVEPTEFGMALAAAFLKKKTPVVAVQDRSKADFFLDTVSNATKEGGGERFAKIMAFGAFAGSGRRFEASVTIANADSIIVFAHNVKKENFQSAAENVANELKKFLAKK